MRVASAADQDARRGALRDDRAQLAADLVGDVHERPERARGEQRVARAPQHPVAAVPSQNARTSADLPIPASPPMSTSRPRPCAATAPRWPSSSSSCSERSSSRPAPVVAPSLMRTS